MYRVSQWCTSTAAGVWDKTCNTVRLVYHVGDQLRIVYNTANSREERRRDLDATVLRAGCFAGAAVLLLVVDAHGGVPNTLRWMRGLLGAEEHAVSSSTVGEGS